MKGVLTWTTATGHKHIGVLYMVTALIFLGIGGLLADVLRTQLAQPQLAVVQPHLFNQIFTLHGTTMIFLAIAPFAFGLANYLIPLQIGAPDMAFPRLNAFTYWLFLLGGLTVFSGLLTEGGAASAGWTAYAPLSSVRVSAGFGQDLWALGLIMTGISGILTAVNFLTTVFIYRAPGMQMWRMPVFTWEMVATSLLIMMAFPPLTAALALLLIDRRMGGHFFDPSAGGSAVLYQHLFWFFGHPEVYVMILPYFGVVTEIVATFSRKPVFGYVGLVLAGFAIAGLSMGVWAHHMFTTGAVNNPFFSALSFLIAVPTGIKYFNWIGTMWGGSIELATPMLFILGFLFNFLIGGITGVMVASPPIDFHVEDSYFLVSHFHYTLGGGSLFAVLAAVFFYFPKVYGVRLREGMGKLAFALSFVGFNLTFAPMFFLGIMGMPRRVATYPPLPGWGPLNLAATCGAAMLTLAFLSILANIAISLRKPIPAGDNPWDGYTLECGTSSPPPEFNFHHLPPIRSERPVFDANHPELSGS